MPCPVIDVQNVGALVRHDQIRIAVAVHVTELQILGHVGRPWQAALRLVGEVARAIVDEERVLAVVGEQDVREAVAVKIGNHHPVCRTLDRQAATFVGEAARAVVEVELVGAVVFAHDHDVEVAVPVEVGHAHVFRIVAGRRQPAAAIAEVAGPVVEQQDVRAEFVRDDDVQVPISVEVANSGVHAQTPEDPAGEVSRGDVGVQGLRRLNRGRVGPVHLRRVTALATGGDQGQANDRGEAGNRHGSHGRPAEKPPVHLSPALSRVCGLPHPVADRDVGEWAQRDLNPRPSDYESAALTT